MPGPRTSTLLHELLELRREHAQLLGYDGWPAFDAEVKMIGKGAAIPEFYDRMAEAADRRGPRGPRPAAAAAAAGPPGGGDASRGSDKEYYAEALRRENGSRSTPRR